MSTISTGAVSSMAPATSAGGSSGWTNAARPAISRISSYVANAGGLGRSTKRRSSIRIRSAIAGGARPWLGRNTNEDCNQRSRLLIRTASNAYFPQIVSVLSLPDRGTAVDNAVGELWDDLQIVDDAAELAFMKRKPTIAAALDPFDDDETLDAIRRRRRGRNSDRPVKQVELDALLAAPEGFGDDVTIDPDFHARRLPSDAWRRSELGGGMASVIQLHRLRRCRRSSGSPASKR